jgi:hypothetical protein
MQPPQSLGHQLGKQEVQSRDVSAGPVEARHQTDLHRVGAAREHDGDGLGCALGRERRWRAWGIDHADLAPEKIGSEFWSRVGSENRWRLLDTLRGYRLLGPFEQCRMTFPACLTAVM